MSLKEASKEVREAAAELLEQPAHETASTAQLYAALAISALRRLEQSGAELEPHVAEAVAAVCKPTRKVLKQMLLFDRPPQEPTKSPQGKRGREADKAAPELDLGQYATSDMFDANEKKKNKFARLMGGGKAHAGENGAPSKHDAVAAKQSVYEKMSKDLESQYDYGLHHKKGKGLGAS